MLAPQPVRVNHSAHADAEVTRGPGESSKTPGLSDLSSIEVVMIEPSPYQPRKVMDDGALGRLAESIRRTGVLQPVLVRPLRAGRFELVAGERRWRAAKMAGLTHVPAMVRSLSDEQAAEHALVENVQREDLNPMERAWALRSLGERFGLTAAQLAERVGLERPTVANLIRLTELEPEIAGMISAGELSAGHGRALLSMAAGEARLGLARRAARETMSVRELERIAPSLTTPITVKASKPGAGMDDARLAVLADLQRQIGQQLGTKVSIVTDRKGKKGRIMMEFYGLDHFDALLSKLGVRTH